MDRSEFEEATMAERAMEALKEPEDYGNFDKGRMYFTHAPVMFDRHGQSTVEERANFDYMLGQLREKFGEATSGWGKMNAWDVTRVNHWATGPIDRIVVGLSRTTWFCLTLVRKASLPCDRCGGVYDRSGRGMPECPDCGMRCGYWEDCDLVDPDDVEESNE